MKSSLRPKSALYGYQVWMAKVIKRRKFVLVSIFMGGGKTAAVLTALRRLFLEMAIRKVLIIAPLLVAEHTWPDEIKAWEHLKNLRYSLILGEEKQRIKALESKAEIHIINRENVAWLWRYLGRSKWKYDAVVYDESSRLKEGRAHVRKKGGGRGRLSEFGVLTRIRQYVNYFIEMSGTPAPNGLIDLWGQIYLLDRGAALGATKSEFLERYFDSDYMGWKHTPKPWAFKAIMEKIKPLMVSLSAEDHADLPPVIPNIVKVSLPKKLMAEYRRFEKTLVTEAYDVEAVSSGVLTNKLLQFANGSLYRQEDEDAPREIVWVHDKKLEALQEIVEQHDGEPILVAYSFAFDLQRILKKFPYAVTPKMDKDWKNKWNAGKLKMLVVHPASMGHGLNLQRGGHIAVWYGLTWSLELYQQFNARLSRPGQESDFVVLHHIVAEGTADLDVLSSMSHKDASQERVNQAVRVRVLANGKAIKYSDKQGRKNERRNRHK